MGLEFFTLVKVWIMVLFIYFFFVCLMILHSRDSVELNGKVISE